MRHVGRFLLVTLVHGILFLVPLVLIAVLAREGYQMVRRLSQPVARLLPEDRFFGILAEDLVSIVAIILLFLIAGLFVGTRPGRLLSDRLERAVLYRVPGYLLVRGAVGSFPGLSTEMRPEPSLVETDDGWAFALLIEREPLGFCTVFEAGWNCDDEHITSTIHVAGGVAGRYEIGALELRRIERRDQLLGELRLVLAAESRHQSKSPSTNFTDFVKLDSREATSFSRLVRCTFASAAWRGPRTLIRRTSSHSNRAGS